VDFRRTRRDRLARIDQHVERRIAVEPAPRDAHRPHLDDARPGRVGAGRLDVEHHRIERDQGSLRVRRRHARILAGGEISFETGAAAGGGRTRPI